MKISGGQMEDGVLIGNTFDKYGSGNPIVKFLMKGYEASLNQLINIAEPKSIHEVGCGEGYWSMKWLAKGFNTKGTDFSNRVIEMAYANAREQNLPDNKFIVRNIYDLDPVSDKADLVVCCQVLEHLEKPAEALLALQRVSNPFLILCLPNEPVWSFLNMARGKYWNAWGNTPGHILRWSKKEFISLVAGSFEIIRINTPLPWTMLLCKVNEGRPA
jgi:2-polyprenyl-3-methyl-5-hydroxy-6-metoxy-1,4-benzoquinol methylase